MQLLIPASAPVALETPVPEAAQAGLEPGPEALSQQIGLIDFSVLLGEQMEDPGDASFLGEEASVALAGVLLDESGEAEEGVALPPPGNPLPVLLALAPMHWADPPVGPAELGALVSGATKDPEGEAPALVISELGIDSSPPDPEMREPALPRRHGAAPVSAEMGVTSSSTATATETSSESTVSLPSPPAGAAPDTARRTPVQLASGSYTIPPPLDHPDWQGAFAERIVWLSESGSQVAALRLNPPTLGSIEVRIAVTDQDTTIQFATRNEVAREAVEAALPRLRHLMADVGLDLARVDVSTELPQRGRDEPPPEPQWARGNPGKPDVPAEPVTMQGPLRGSGGLIDSYA